MYTLNYISANCVNMPPFSATALKYMQPLMTAKGFLSIQCKHIKAITDCRSASLFDSEQHCW